MSALQTSFSEASADPQVDKRDEETIELHKRSPPNSTQNLFHILDEALNKNYSPIEKLRSSQSTPVCEGVEYVDVNVQHGTKTVFTRHYFPKGKLNDASLPLILFIHDGGWCLSSVEHRNHFASELSKRHNVEVVSVNNSLSPEAEFGEALNELFSVYKSLLSKSRKIFVCGDSSGGNQAPCLVHKIIENNVRIPDALLIFYPVIDLVNKYPSHEIYKNGFSLDFDLMQKYIQCYCPPEFRKSPLASPIQGDLSKFPPSLVVTSQFDILRNEGLEFARKLDKSGVTVRYICLETAEHGFLNHPQLKKIENICHGYISDFLKFF